MPRIEDEPTEKLTRHWVLLDDATNPRLATAVLLARHGEPLRVNYDRIYTGDDHREYVPIDASESGSQAYDAVLADLQIAAMLTALDYNGGGLDPNHELRKLRERLEAFNWPTPHAVDQILAKALSGAPIHRMRTANHYRTLATTTENNTGLLRLAAEADDRQLRFAQDERHLLARVPGAQPLQGSLVTNLVSAAIGRVFPPASAA